MNRVYPEGEKEEIDFKDMFKGIGELLPKMEKKILSIDAGTTETGYCVVDFNTLKPEKFGKIANEEILNVINSLSSDDVVVLEQFKSYGMAIGQSTMDSIQWNGRFIQRALDKGMRVDLVARMEEKMCLCNSSKAKDGNIRQALIDRFGEVGTKKNPGFFYGFAKDAWSAMAIAVTWKEREISKQMTENK